MRIAFQPRGRDDVSRPVDHLPDASDRLAGLRSWPAPGFEDVRPYDIVGGEVLRIVRVRHGRRDIGSILAAEPPSAGP